MVVTNLISISYNSTLKFLRHWSVLASIIEAHIDFRAYIFSISPLFTPTMAVVPILFNTYVGGDFEVKHTVFKYAASLTTINKKLTAGRSTIV